MIAITAGAGASVPRAHRGSTTNWPPGCAPGMASSVPATRSRSVRPATKSALREPRMSRPAVDRSAGTGPGGAPLAAWGGASAAPGNGGTGVRGDERRILLRIHDDHGYLQALAGRAHGQRKHGEALDPGHTGDLVLGSGGDPRADRGRGDDGVGARGLPGRHGVAALHGAAGHRGEGDHGEREDERERGQHAGLRRAYCPGPGR